MSLIIENIVLHQLAFDASGACQLLARPDCLEVTKGVEEFIEDVHRVYNAKPGKGYASFKEDAEDFEQQLGRLKDGATDFYPFSLFTAEKLVEEISKYDFVEQGYLMIAKYQALATDYLVLALLGTKEHISVDEQLDLSQASHLDLGKMQLALRLDLTELAVNREQGRYISFIKGRAGRKVADFFLDFIGCAETIDARQQSKTLVKAVEDYMDAEQFSPDEKSSQRKDLLDFCTEHSDMGQEIDLKSVAEKITPAGSDNDFFQFSKQGNYELEESFPADRSGFKNMTKFSGQGGGVSVGFDKSLLGSRVMFNEHADTLTIHQVPPNLKDQLLRYLKGEQE